MGFLKTGIYARPGKTFQFRILKKRLNTAKGKIGIDAGSANMKNCRMFKTGAYIGIDIDEAALKLGLERFKNENVFGLVSDISKIDNLPDGSADAVVSTNTIYHLLPENQNKAMLHLIRITKSDGILICELPINLYLENYLKLFKDNFDSIKIYYFKNIFSQIYEKLLEKNGHLGNDSLGGRKPFLLISYFLSLIEHLTYPFKSINKHVLIIISDKKENKPNFEFSLDKFKKIGDRLYVLR